MTQKEDEEIIPKGTEGMSNWCLLLHGFSDRVRVEYESERECGGKRWLLAVKQR